VAASTASLFAFTLAATGEPNARFLEVFTYSVIVSTVVVQGFTAGWVARLLGVTRSQPRGWLIVGAHRLSREIARRLTAAGIPCVIVDTSGRAVRECEGDMICLREDALDRNLPERLNEYGIGQVLALTDNEDLNTLVCQAWAQHVGSSHVYRWASGTGFSESDSVRHGTIVWPSVPKPSVASYELDRRLARIEMAAAGETPATQIVLGTIANGTFHLNPLHAETPADQEGVTLYLQRFEHLLARCLDHRIFLRSDANDLVPVVTQLAHECSKYYPELVPELTAAEVMEREQMRQTSIGHGFAVPHASFKGLKTHVCAVAVVPQGLSMSTPDREPVRVILLVLSPTGDPEGRLTIMAEVARLASVPGAADALTSAKDGSDMAHLVQRLSASHSPNRDSP